MGGTSIDVEAIGGVVTGDSDVERQFQIGKAAWESNDLLAAEAALRQAWASTPGNPAIRAALGATLLKLGRLNEGFPLFDAWREMPEKRTSVPPNLPLPRWRGQPVSGKRILIWSEDGFGDQIMWARLVRRFADDGADVQWICPPELERLFALSLGVTALPADQSFELTGVDFWSPSSALASGFDMDISQLPPSPYLAPPPLRAGGKRVGVMTAGNARNLPGAPRGLPSDLGAELRAGLDAISLAPEATGARDFYDTAAIIAGLDLVVTVDTAVAHLAGAMGRPVWILLPFTADWRWFSERSDSPWYPSARLFRQPSPGDWRAVVDQVTAEASASL